MPASDRSARRLTPQRLTTAGVSLATVALALAGGGYGVAVRGIAEIIVWWIVGLGLVLRWWPVSRLPRAVVVAGGALTAFMALTGLSTLWVENDARILEEVVRIAGYLGLFILVAIASRLGDARSWLAGLAIGIALVGTLGILSRVIPDAFPEQELLTSLTGSAARLSYPVNYWNAMAAMMATGVVLLVFFGSSARTRGLRTAATAAGVVPALALFLTSSRGGVLACVLGLALMLAMSPIRWRMIATVLAAVPAIGALIGVALTSDELLDGRLDDPAAQDQGAVLLAVLVVGMLVTAFLRRALDPRIERLGDRLGGPAAPRRAIFAAAALVAAGVIVAVDPIAFIRGFTDAPIGRGETGFVREHLASSTGSGRYQYWEVAVNAFASHPIFGAGPGRYADLWLSDGTLALYVRDAHSLWFEVLAELGIVGLALIGTFLVTPVVVAVRNRRRPEFLDAGPAAAAVLLIGLLSASIDWTWEIPSAFGLTVVAAALIAGAALNGHAPDSAAKGYTLGVATVAVGWVVVCISVVILLTDVQLDRSREAVARGDLAGALESARQAKLVQPWASEPRLQIALVQERAGDLMGARATLLEAIDRAPSDWRLWVISARLDRKVGDNAGALFSLNRVRALNPRSVIFQDPEGK